MRSYHAVPLAPTEAEAGGVVAALPPQADEDGNLEFADDEDDSDEQAAPSPFKEFYDVFYRVLSPLETGLAGLALFLEVLRGLSTPALLLVVHDWIGAMHELDHERALERVTGSAKAFAGFAVAVAVVLSARKVVCDYVCGAVGTKYEKAFVYRLHRVDMAWQDNQGAAGVEAWLDLCAHGYENAAVRGGFAVLSSSVSVLGCVGLLFALAWQLALVAAVAVAAVLLVYSGGQRMLADAEETFRRVFRDAEEAFATLLTGRHLRLVQVYGLEGVAACNLSEKLQEVEKAEARRRSSGLLVQGVFGAAAMVLLGVLVWFAGAYVMPAAEVGIAAAAFCFFFSVCLCWLAGVECVMRCCCC
jgi:ABC-type multidrug transport system fused ATPase/permease subunit